MYSLLTIHRDALLGQRGRERMGGRRAAMAQRCGVLPGFPAAKNVWQLDMLIAIRPCKESYFLFMPLGP